MTISNLLIVFFLFIVAIVVGRFVGRPIGKLIKKRMDYKASPAVKVAGILSELQQQDRALSESVGALWIVISQLERDLSVENILKTMSVLQNFADHTPALSASALQKVVADYDVLTKLVTGDPSLLPLLASISQKDFWNSDFDVDQAIQRAKQSSLP